MIALGFGASFVCSGMLHTSYFPASSQTRGKSEVCYGNCGLEEQGSHWLLFVGCFGILRLQTQCPPNPGQPHGKDKMLCPPAWGQKPGTLGSLSSVASDLCEYGWSAFSLGPSFSIFTKKGLALEGSGFGVIYYSCGGG